jgi:cytochrome oxidase Cu insertion factor (SCO1/SenC/PrrC family)
MTIATLKKALKTLTPQERRRMMAYLITLDDQDNTTYRRRLADKIDSRDPAQWVDLDDLPPRLGLAETGDGE